MVMGNILYRVDTSLWMGLEENSSSKRQQLWTLKVRIPSKIGQVFLPPNILMLVLTCFWGKWLGRQQL